MITKLYNAASRTKISATLLAILYIGRQLMVINVAPSAQVAAKITDDPIRKNGKNFFENAAVMTIAAVIPARGRL